MKSHPNLKVFSAVVFLVAFGAGSAPAFQYSWDQIWPVDSGHPGAFTKSVPGRFTGEAREHLAVIKGGQLYILFEPSSFQMLTPTGYFANDIGTLWGYERENPIDQECLISIGPSGLRLSAFRADLDDVGRIIDASPDFLNGRRVCVGLIDGDANADIVVLGADSHTVLVKTSNSALFFENSSHGFSHPNEIYEMAVMATSLAPSGHAIALLTSVGLEIVAFTSGEVLASFPSPNASLCSMAILRGSSPIGDDQVLWCTPESSIGVPMDLYVAEPGLLEFMDATTDDIVSLSVGYLNQGNYQDSAALIGSTGNIVLLYSFENELGERQFSFDSDRSFKLFWSVGSFNGPRFPNPVIHDFNHNGEDDLLCPLADDSSIRLFPGRMSRGWADWDVSEETLGNGSLLGEATLLENRSEYETGGGLPTLELSMTFPGASEVVFDPSYKLEAAVLVKHHSSEELEVHIPHHAFTPLSQVPFEFGGEGELILKPVVPLESSEQSAFFLYYRVVRVGTAGISNSGPAVIVALCDELPNSQTIRNEIYDEYRHQEWEAWETTGGSRINSLIRVRRTWKSPENSTINP